MRKTKFEKIKEQKKKVLNKEILYYVDKILSYQDDVCELLLKIVIDLNKYGKLSGSYLKNYLLYGYELIEKLDDEVTNNE